MAKKFKGVYPPIVTPFEWKTQEINETELRKMVSWMIENGTHGLIPCGSCGEFANMSLEERKKVYEIVVDEAAGRVPVVCGTHDCLTKNSVMLTRYAKDIGADGVMVVPPYYYKSDERELHDHYGAIAQVGLPIMVYNNPFTSKIDLSPELIAKLSEDFDNIDWYVKECSGDITRVRKIIQLSEEKVSVFIGMDSTAIEAFVMGAAGWVTALSHIVPRKAADVFDLAVNKKNFEKARGLFLGISPLADLFEGTPKFPQTIKAAMELTGVIKAGPPRRPLLPLDEKEKEAVKKVLVKIKVLTS